MASCPSSSLQIAISVNPNTSLLFLSSYPFASKKRLKA
jgi:hypothetical protein